jgi:hypothetical protein
VDIDVPAVVQQTRLGLSGMKKGGPFSGPQFVLQCSELSQSPGIRVAEKDPLMSVVLTLLLVSVNSTFV